MFFLGVGSGHYRKVRLRRRRRRAVKEPIYVCFLLPAHSWRKQGYQALNATSSPKDSARNSVRTEMLQNYLFGEPGM